MVLWCVCLSSVRYVLWQSLLAYRRTVWRRKYGWPHTCGINSDPPYDIQMGVLTAPPNIWWRVAAKPLQLAAWLLLTVYRNQCPIHWCCCQPPTDTFLQNLHVALRPNCVIRMVTINRLPNNALSNASVYCQPSPSPPNRGNDLSPIHYTLVINCSQTAADSAMVTVDSL